MTPTYEPGVFPAPLIDRLLGEIPWVEATEARRECFMAEETFRYTYGSGRGVRTYQSVPYLPMVRQVLNALNRFGVYGDGYNVCFLNRYEDDHQHLGWHADDSPGMRHEHPIAVVSFGAERDIWWREPGQVGEVPSERRQRLGSGSVFVMPPGFQQRYQHRIPKGDRACGPRVSLTFRRYVPEDRVVPGRMTFDEVAALPRGSVARFTTTQHLSLFSMAAEVVSSPGPLTSLNHLTGTFETYEGTLSRATPHEVEFETDEVRYAFCRRHFDDLQVQVHP